MVNQKYNRSLLRWDVWWWWMLASVLSVIIAIVSYHSLPQELAHPLNEDIWLIQPWRIVLVNSLFYLPQSVLQWFVLRRYAHHAWWWPMTTLGSVIVLYPCILWVLWSLGYYDIAADIWFIGLGSSTIYIVAQWVTLVFWMQNKWLGLIWIIIAPMDIIIVLFVNALINGGLIIARNSLGEYFVSVMQTASLWVLYHIAIGTALAIILRNTTPGQKARRTFHTSL